MVVRFLQAAPHDLRLISLVGIANFSDDCIEFASSCLPLFVSVFDGSHNAIRDFVCRANLLR